MKELLIGIALSLLTAHVADARTFECPGICAKNGAVVEHAYLVRVDGNGHPILRVCMNGIIWAKYDHATQMRKLRKLALWTYPPSTFVVEGSIVTHNTYSLADWMPTWEHTTK